MQEVGVVDSYADLAVVIEHQLVTDEASCPVADLLVLMASIEYLHTYINHITCLAKQWYTNLSYSKRPLMFISIFMGHELYKMIERDELDFITTSIEPTLQG